MKKGFVRWVVFIHIAIITGLGLYIGIVLLIAYINDYKPSIKENITTIPQKSITSKTITETEFSILSWNIGYCGLGKEQDFFYDGGYQVRPSHEEYQKYINGVFHSLSKFDYLDFILLQEVDINSKRSYYTNQLETLKEALPEMSFSYAKNYDVGFVPIPFFEPMGKVSAGMTTWSTFIPKEATRIGFDVNFSWWKRIFMLDRCLILTRYRLNNGKDFVLINIHNSAFDDKNILKPVELNAIKVLMIEEYQKGNFVVAGGDWNQNPPNFKPTMIDKQWNPVAIDQPIPKDLLPSNWKWAFPINIPTERFNDKPFEKGKNKTTTIDFFVASPNVNIHSIETINLEFKFSDHQPVMMTFGIASDSTGVEK